MYFVWQRGLKHPFPAKYAEVVDINGKSLPEILQKHPLSLTECHLDLDTLAKIYPFQGEGDGQPQYQSDQS